MIRIAACDDEDRCLNNIRDLFDAYIKEHPECDASIELFNSTLDFMGAREKRRFDAYILDIYIDAQSGIDLAESIRKDDEKAVIIFLTTSEFHYKDAFRLNAAHYLEKPIDPKEFADAMGRVLKAGNERYYAVKDGDGIHRIPVNDILYVMSEDHYKDIVCRDGAAYLVRETMANIMEGLGEENFYLLSNKLIINLKKILTISSAEVTMEDGRRFSLPRGSYRAVSDLFLKYSFE
ncbi:two component transcriptional regulator, LytTR family [Lachnospiraceae bacterium]|nr:two component transcriptional regulator, LytTR family [Lachnospiraceae bacterium]